MPPPPSVLGRLAGVLCAGGAPPKPVLGVPSPVGLAPFLRPSPESGTARLTRSQEEHERPAGGGRQRAGPGSALFGGRTLMTRPCGHRINESRPFRVRHRPVGARGRKTGSSSPCSSPYAASRQLRATARGSGAGHRDARFAGPCPPLCVDCAPPRRGAPKASAAGQADGATAPGLGFPCSRGAWTENAASASILPLSADLQAVGVHVMARPRKPTSAHGSRVSPPTDRT